MAIRLSSRRRIALDLELDPGLGAGLATVLAAGILGESVEALLGGDLTPTREAIELPILLGQFGGRWVFSDSALQLAVISQRVQVQSVAGARSGIPLNSAGVG